MRVPFTLCSALLVLLGLTAIASAQRPVIIGVVTDGYEGGDKMVADALIAEIASMNAPEFAVTAPASKRVYGQESPLRVAAGLSQLLADPEVRLVIGVGPLASQMIASQPVLPKPAFAPFVFDPEVQRLPRTADGRSGVKNLNYLSLPYDIGRALEQVRTIFGARKVAMLAPGTEFQMLPGIRAVIEGIGKKAGVELVLLPYGTDPGKEIAAIPADVQAVIITPDPQIRENQFKALIEAINTRKLPSFAFLDGRAVEQGVLAADVPRRYFERLRRRLALNVQRTLDGEDPGTFPTTFDGGAARLWINLATAKQIGHEFDWPVIIEARVVGDPPKAERMLTLEGVMKEVMERNLDIRAKALERDVGLQEIERMRGFLFPSASLSVQGAWIDEDRAQTSFGNSPQYLLDGTLSVSQPVYSNDGFAAVDIQESVQKTREAALRALQLDMVQAAAAAWYNVLRSQSLIETTTLNLEAARENLELALVRRSVGATTEADVLRWKSEIARLKQSLIQAFAGLGQARIQLNRLLDRPDAEEFGIAPEATRTEALVGQFALMMGFLESRSRFAMLSDFLAEEAVRNAPEITQLDASIEATELDLARITRGYYLPSVVLSGSANYKLWKGGEGKDAVSPDPTVAAPDDLVWTLALGVSFPLFDMARYSEAEKARVELRRLQVTRESLARQLRQRVQSELLSALSSFSAIGLSREQRDAAHQSLALTSQAYRVGSVSIADLVDAQTNAFGAEQGAVNAVYDFMIAMTNVERAMGIVQMNLDAADKAGFVQRLQQHFAGQAGGAPHVPTDAPDATPTPNTP